MGNRVSHAKILIILPLLIQLIYLHNQ